MADESIERQLALAVVDVNWFTTENLFREARLDSVSLLTMRCMDYVNGLRKGIAPWSRRTLQSRTSRSFHRDLVLPSGWMKRYPRIGMRPIARSIKNFWKSQGANQTRGLVLTYPHYTYMLDRLQPELGLYYNLDDYALYWPNDATEVRRLEREAVLRTNATVCVARFRAEALRNEIPEAKDRIHHLPHGTPSAFLQSEPFHQPGPAPADIAHLRRPLLGYIGSMEDRVDWALMLRLSETLPTASLVLVGRPPGEFRHPPQWILQWRELTSRPNVHVVGWRHQADLPAYYGAFDVVLIPYLASHPFNLACSPTKIMDGMGSGRPIVATEIPETRLHSHLFDVACGHDDFLNRVEVILASRSDDGRAGLRHAFAHEHSCQKTAERLFSLMGR